jgi:hypothetical protein
MNKRAIEQAIKYDLYSSGTVRGYISNKNGLIEKLEFNKD